MKSRNRFGWSVLARVLLAVLIVVVGQNSAQAAFSIHIGGAELTGSGAGSILSNSIVLLFENTVNANEVKLTIDVNGSNYKVKDVVFNVDPGLTGLALSFTKQSGPTASTSFSANSKGLGNPLKGFDIGFGYGTSGALGDLYSGGPLSVYLIKKTAGTGTLTENSFNFATAGGYFAGAHINKPEGYSQTNENSGKYGGGIPQIPEPSTLAIWSVLGLLGLVKARRSAITG